MAAGAGVRAGSGHARGPSRAIPEPALPRALLSFALLIVSAVYGLAAVRTPALTPLGAYLPPAPLAWPAPLRAAISAGWLVGLPPALLGLVAWIVGRRRRAAGLGAAALCPVAAWLLGLPLEPALVAALAAPVGGPAAAAGTARPRRAWGRDPPAPEPAARAAPGPTAADGLLAWSPDAVVAFDSEGIVVGANRTARALLGHELTGHPIGRYLPSLREAGRIVELADAGRPVELPAIHESSRPLVVEASFRTGAGLPWAGLVRLTDVSERRARLAELERLALHDSLTGLPNRLLLHDRLKQAIGAAERTGQPLAVMLLDLDRFKQVNDTLGHHVGDRLLRQVGPRLAAPLRKADTLARLGGDEFAVLLPAPTSLERACRVAERLIERLVEPFVIEGMRLEIGVSIGVAIYPDHGRDLDALLQQADTAMYKAKRERLGFVVFDTETSDADRLRTTLHRDLRAAIDNGQLAVRYQLKVGSGTREPVGAEALVRWHHPQLGLLEPKDFLPVAEQTGLVDPLTVWVLNACLRDQQRWRRAGILLPVSVNLPGRWLEDAKYPAILGMIIAHWGARPAELGLEIAESAVMADVEGTLPGLEALARLGCGLSLDDFGSGYSSLVHLQRLPVRELKIHRQFVTAMTEDKAAAVVVRSIVRLAHGLGLKAVATGVETDATAHWLTTLKCDELQGFAFGRPMDAAQLHRRLAQPSSEVPA